MTEIGSLEDQLRLEILDKQVDILIKLADVTEKFKLPREVWLELVFKKYMHLPDELVHSFMKALPPEAQQQLESSERHGKPAPREVVLLREIASGMEQKGAGAAALKHLREAIQALDGLPPRLAKQKSRRLWESSDQRPDKLPVVADGDLIVNSTDQVHQLSEDIRRQARAAAQPNVQRQWKVC